MLHGNFLAMGNRSAAMVPGKLSQNARGWQACFGQPHFLKGPGGTCLLPKLLKKEWAGDKGFAVGW